LKLENFLSKHELCNRQCVSVEIAIKRHTNHSLKTIVLDIFLMIFTPINIISRLFMLMVHFT